jgi:hypothetical protein
MAILSFGVASGCLLVVPSGVVPPAEHAPDIHCFGIYSGSGCGCKASDTTPLPSWEPRNSVGPRGRFNGTARMSHLGRPLLTRGRDPTTFCQHMHDPLDRRWSRRPLRAVAWGPRASSPGQYGTKNWRSAEIRCLWQSIPTFSVARLRAMPRQGEASWAHR